MKNFTEKTEQQYLELSCNLEELEKIKECIFCLPVDMGMKKKIYLVCDEIFSNIVNYSGADRVQFGCNKNADKVNAVFIDNGKPFNPLESKSEKDFEDFLPARTHSLGHGPVDLPCLPFCVSARFSHWRLGA